MKKLLLATSVVLAVSSAFAQGRPRPEVKARETKPRLELDNKEIKSEKAAVAKGKDATAADRFKVAEEVLAKAAKTMNDVAIKEDIAGTFLRKVEATGDAKLLQSAQGLINIIGKEGPGANKESMELIVKMIDLASFNGVGASNAKYGKFLSELAWEISQKGINQGVKEIEGRAEYKDIRGCKKA